MRAGWGGEVAQVFLLLRDERCRGGAGRGELFGRLFAAANLRRLIPAMVMVMRMIAVLINRIRFYSDP